MSLEGSRKFVTMWLGVVGLIVVAKFGATWGGVFETIAPYIAIVLGTGIYMLYNYLQKTTADTFVPDNWLAGKRVFIGAVLAVVAPLLGGFGNEIKDATTQMLATFCETLVPVVFMITQSLSDKKMAALPPTLQAKSASSSVTAQAFSDVTFVSPSNSSDASTTPNVGASTPSENSLRKRIAAGRASLSASWEATKSYLIGTFNVRFEAALKRFADINMSTIEATRRAVMEVMGVQLDDKTCQAIGQIPGFLGALGAGLDVTRILPDLLAAIDRTPELAYMKTAFTKRAIWYSVKEAVDNVTLRCQSGITETAKAALMEAGMSLWEAEKTIPFLPSQMYYTTQKDPNTGAGIPGTYGYRDFSVFVLAGVDPYTMEDL